jgi:nicotinate-nucleotide adenylyltransferase
MKKVGLYFGTFNPIHIGHIIIANHMVEFSDLEEVWFVVTPQSPFKVKKTLLDNNHRYQMVREATADYPKLKSSTIEFNLPEPNYTIDTLAHLSEKYPDGYQFCLIMEVILEHYELFVYPRVSEGKTEHRFIDHPRVHKVNAPIIEISSTFIRTEYKKGKNIRPLLPDAVWKYMDEMNFYR